jgi:hypothetical protein
MLGVLYPPGPHQAERIQKVIDRLDTITLTTLSRMSAAQRLRSAAQ